MYIVRKPESIRRPALQRRANTTSGGTRNLRLSPLRLTGSSSPCASALAGSRIERMVAPANTTNANRSDHWEPNVEASPASGAATAAPTTPASEIRLLALTSVKSAARSRGTVAARATPYAFEETRTPRAVGNIASDCGRHGVGHQPAQEGAQRHGAADRPAPAVAEPVEEGPEKGSNDRERQHRESEEERDLPARLARLGEEQGPRQRDGDRRVAGGVERVQLDQPVEAGVARTLGARGAARLAEGVRRGGAGSRAGALDPAASGAGNAAARPGRVPGRVGGVRSSARPPCPHPVKTVSRADAGLAHEGQSSM